MIFTSALISALSGIQMDNIIHKRVFDMIMVSGVTVIPLVIAQFVTNAVSKIESIKDP